MMRFIKNPNLPERRVSRIICGKIPLYAEIFFKQREIEILKIEANLQIDPAVSAHADMCALHLGGNKVVVDNQQTDLIEKLDELGYDIIKTKDPISGKYPDDVKVNVALFGNNAVGAFSYSDSSVLVNIGGFSKFEVKQGYAKCSILPVNEKAVITDDPSIYKTLKNAFDVLWVEKGDIVLEGHSYGFVGGASTKISNDEIFFFGNLESHRNHKEILAFLEKHSCKAIYLKNTPLTDVGGVVSLSEYI